MKPEERWNQEQAWTNSNDGILMELWKLPEFSKFKQPAYASVLNHITVKKTGLFAKHAYLFTPGQDEPQPAVTEGTKDEAPPSEFEQLLQECYDLKKEAEQIENDKKAKTQVRPCVPHPHPYPYSHIAP